KVGFRDDTSYLAVHYGGRVPGQAGRPTSSDIAPSPPGARSCPRLSSLRGKPTEMSTRPANGTCASTSRSAISKTTLASRADSTKDGGQADTRRAGEVGSSLVRPSLSEQLASIGKAAQEITMGLRLSHGLKPLNGAMLTTPSESFLVGKLRCKYPSPVMFFNHKCVYTFHHPFEASRITMEMFFRDMRCATLEAPRRELRFKIDHPLCHYAKDYSYDDPSHFVAILFSSDSDTERVNQQVMPLIRRCASVR
ncbi:unnamed protein product, partial [Hapterophycus canaliculatus]